MYNLVEASAAEHEVSHPHTVSERKQHRKLGAPEIGIDQQHLAPLSCKHAAERDSGRRLAFAGE